MYRRTLHVAYRTHVARTMSWTLLLILGEQMRLDVLFRIDWVVINKWLVAFIHT